MRDVQAYLAAPIANEGEVFEVAKTVASQATSARANIATTREVSVSYGFLGRKTRPERIAAEVTTDYWVLLSKTADSKRWGDARDYGGNQEEETEQEIQFCLGIDGSFRILERERNCVLWVDPYRYDVMSWSEWVPRHIESLNHFLVDFDFDGSVVTSGHCWSGRTDIVGDIGRYSHYNDSGANLRLRRLYQKGSGLVDALGKLL